MFTIDGRMVEEGNINIQSQIGKTLKKGTYLLRLSKNDELKTIIVLKN